MANKTKQKTSLLYDLKDKLLKNKQPYEFPGITIETLSQDFTSSDSIFFDFIQPAPKLVDMIIGEVKGSEEAANLALSAAIKSYLTRFAKSTSRGQYFDKIHLWENNFLTPQEIGQLFQNDFDTILRELGFQVSLFYGRMNLEYHTFTYLNCGFDKIIYYNSLQSTCTFLRNLTCSQFPSNVTITESLHSKHIPIHSDDLLFFYSKEIDREEVEDYCAIFSIVKQQPHSEARDVLVHLKEKMNSYRKEEEFNSSHLLMLKVNTKLTVSTKHKRTKFVGDLSQLQAVRSFVRQVCYQTSGDVEKLSLQLELVVNEIFCNIVKHAYQDSDKGEVLVESEISAEGIYFTISDKGKIFNPSEVDYPNLYGEQESGFGIFIIQQLVDQISYIPKHSESGWNHLRIFKRYFSVEDRMEFTHYVQDKVLVITPTGDNLDAKNASNFKERVLTLIRDSGILQVTFDLQHLHFIDSSGLGTFLSLQRSLNSQGGGLKLSHLNKPIKTMFEIVSMHRIFDIFNSTEEAIHSF